jgi:lipid-A-disaccharide synthase-like uncharacterized protein
MAMIDGWREILYPLGFLSALAFGARFILQWIKSEIRQKSVVTSSFWKLSLVGNSMLFLHSFIQMQFHVCIIQVINGVISWRNLNLMRASSRHWRTRSVMMLLALLLGATLLLFAIQESFVLDSGSAWFRIPSHSWNAAPLSIDYFWHLFGFAGLVLFNSRFWLQWWHAEKTQTSTLGYSFWWISLIGAFCSIIYFARIQDPVNLIGPAIGIIPYIRNLMLLSKSKSAQTTAAPS